MTDTTQIDLITQQLRAFGANFERAYLQAGFSKKSLAAVVSPDRAGITKIERGERAPNLSTLLELSAAVGRTPAELLDRVAAPGAEIVPVELDGKAPQDPYKRLVANLCWARARTHDPYLTQEELADEANVDRSSLSGYETGRLAPNLRTIVKLAGPLGVAPAVLLDGVVLRK